MYADQREIPRNSFLSDLLKTGLALAVLTSALWEPAGLSAAAFVRMTAQQAEGDTTEVVRLAPIEVAVLRTPVLQDESPLAVAALTGDDLHRGRSGFFLEEALQGLPGVQVQNRFNPAVGERVAIRGFGGRAQFGLRGIRVIVDGIPATLPDGQSSLDHLDIGSLGRVEVIRGPASALYGNASGGVLSFSTRDPALAPYRVEAMGVTGSDGLWRGQLTASGTVNQTGYVVTASGQTWDGYRNIASGSARADTLGSMYGGSDRFGLNARVTRAFGGGELALTANVLDLDAENPGSKGDDFSEDVFREINDVYLRFRTGKELQQQQVGLRWVGSLGDAIDADFSAYGVHRTINNPIPADIIDLSRNGGGLRAQLGSTFATGVGDLELLGGVEYDLQDDDRSEVEVAFGSGLPADEPFLDQTEEVRSAGVFLQSTLELAGGAIALAGIRYDNQEFTATDHVPVTTEDPDDSGSRTMEAFSPSLGLSVPAGDAFNLFGSVGRVFETPTTSELSNQPDAAGGFSPDLDPLTGTSYEVGVRGRIGSVAAFEVTAYHTDLSDELVRFELEGFEDRSFYRNSGASTHRGVEATLSAASANGLFRGDVTYTHTDARFDDYVVEVDGEEVQLGKRPDASNGNRVPGVAPNRAQAKFRVSPGPWWTELVVSHVSDVQVDDFNSAVAPSYSVVDLRAGLDELEIGGVTVSPWLAVINALDEDYVASVAVNAFGNRFFEPGPDRSFQIGLRTAFGGEN